MESELRLFEYEEKHYHESKRWKECIINREYKHSTCKILDIIKNQSYAKKNTAAKWDIEDIVNDEIKYETHSGTVSSKKGEYEKCVISSHRLEQFQYLLESIDKFIKK